jgi:hypothetical protein
MYWSFLKDLLPIPTKLIYYVENIKSTNFILGKNTKSTNLQIHKLVIFNQTTKIDTHEEKYFHSKWNIVESVVKHHSPNPLILAISLDYCEI